MYKHLLTAAIVAALSASAMVSVPATAQVGEQLSKSLSRNINLDEDFLDGIQPEADHVFIKYLRTYVPAQRSNGEAAEPVAYNSLDGFPIKTRDGAKPLIGVMMYGPVISPEAGPEDLPNIGGFVGHGRRDAYAAVSLDDGDSWKTTNLSESADRSSFELEYHEVWGSADYPGDVINIVHAVAGNHVAAAWPSRFCRTGSPAYALDETELDGLATYLGSDPAVDLYLTDLFGVGGSQGSVNYAESRQFPFPSVGEVPFSCLWVARGVLLETDDPRTDGVTEDAHVVWYKAERLTSGRRDVNRVEIAMVENGGVAVTWQEDPEGLRPGRGLGPGEGWSGATAHSQTDIWYSFLPWQHFTTVADEAGAPIALTDYWTVDATKPKPYVPFAVPMRLTNNARCGGEGPGEGEKLWCEPIAVEYGLKDQCVDTVNIPTGRDDELTPICVNEDGLPNIANTAATRPRLSLQSRDADGDGMTDGAWVVVVTEEDKGMGSFFFRNNETGTTATPCLDENDDTCEVADIGKNVWYFSFDMGSPRSSADLSGASLVRNLVTQGNMLNQPEINWRTGEFHPPLNTADMWDFEAYNFPIYRTEVARRGSLLVQPEYDISASVVNAAPGSNAGGVASRNTLMALPLYKQGQLEQGGPADIFGRRIINAGVSVNPYDFDHMVCAEKLFTDGSNPYYPKGICLSPAINVSGTTPRVCEQGGGGNDESDGVCPTIDASGIASQDPENQRVFDRVETWVQCPGSPDCGDFDPSTALGSNLDDQSWYNSLDVAKGHRGYLWRDMAVVMYAWSPNWKLNRVGNDRWELYIRRSFDGGKTWTTTPPQWGGKGTTTCEFMRDGVTTGDSTSICTSYKAGADEQARNVTQLSNQFGEPTNRFTILDPRYAPDPPTMRSIDGLYYDPDSDAFNPSRFFVVYETGDNDTTAEGEAESLDLFYGRAVRFGDHYQVWAREDDIEATCLPGVTADAGTFCNEFDRLTRGSDVQASEASLTMSPAGDTLYSVWAQGNYEDPPTEGPLTEARHARVWYEDLFAKWVAPTAAPARREPVMGM
ncbi:MAG: choice-of-anchor O protein [Wenzhouxiangella sp.]|jgi:hypothetical protein|nr:choice-of-anchor O protein [Wenzhouxiangella sp.]